MTGPIFLSGGVGVIAEFILLKLLFDRGVSPEAALASALLLYTGLRVLIEGIIVMRLIRLRAGVLRGLLLPLILSALLALPVFLLVANAPLPALALVLISLVITAGGYAGVFYFLRKR